MRAFVGADRNRPRDGEKLIVGTGGQGLFDQRDAGRGAGKRAGDRNPLKPTEPPAAPDCMPPARLTEAGTVLARAT